MPRRRGKLDPTLFSFWLAANLPLDDDARQELLMLDSVVMRLRCGAPSPHPTPAGLGKTVEGFCSP